MQAYAMTMLSVSIPLSIECLYQSLWNFECLYHGTWVNLNGVLHKFLSCLCIPTIIARQRLGRHIPVAMNTRNNRIIVGGIVFYTVRVVSKESLRVCLWIILWLLGNGSVNTSPRQRRIVGGVVFYAVCVVSKKRRRLEFSPELLVFLWK
jgi:hypothetical protein